MNLKMDLNLNLKMDLNLNLKMDLKTDLNWAGLLCASGHELTGCGRSARAINTKLPKRQSYPILSYLAEEDEEVWTKLSERRRARAMKQLGS